MKIMSSIRDLVLNYAYNVAKNKSENQLEFQKQILSGLKTLREKYPELLFVNYENSISEEESKDVFMSIKSKVRERYRISYIPSSLTFVEVIGGQRIEIPGLINLENGGYLCIRYDSHDTKKKLLNQVLLHLLIQLPIKNILFSFVDLSGNYDEDFFIKKVDPSIYHGRPITSDIQLEELLEKLEQRRFDVTRKYGEYSIYCQEHSAIPIPYVFIVLLDNDYDAKFRQRLNNIISSGYKYGVYVIEFQNTSGFQFPDNCILNPNGDEAYYSSHLVPNDIESFDLSGDFYYLPNKQGSSVPNSSLSDVNVIQDDFIARGYGDYEVVLSVGEQYDNTNVNSLYPVFCNEMGIPQKRIDEILNTGTDIVLAAFPTREEANEYIDKLCMQYRLPEYITCAENSIYFEPCWRSGRFLSLKIHMGLWVPQSTCNVISEYREDLKFYMNELGVTGDLFNRMVHCISGGTALSRATRYIDQFKTFERANDGIEMFQNMLAGHAQKNMDYYLYYFDKENEVYIDDDIVDQRPFSGIAISYWDDPKFDKENKCRDYIINIEQELHKSAIKKWGKQYYRSHLIIGRASPGLIAPMEDDFYRIKICKRSHSKKAVWKYEVPNTNGLINYTPITENKHLLDACLDYINSEAVDNKEDNKTLSVEKPKTNDESQSELNIDDVKLFYLDEIVKEQMLTVKSKFPLAFMGKTLDDRQKDLYIKLNEDCSENVLLLGQNDQEQVTRTTMNLFVSLMMSAKLKNKDIAFKVIDCLNNEEGEVHELIFDLGNEGLCEIIERRQRSKFFKDLAQSVQDGTAEETILLILGQDRFRELKMDMELDDDNNNKSKATDDNDMTSISEDSIGGRSSLSPSVKTYRDALNVILEKGPDYGVHTLLQLEKVSNLLFEENTTPKVVFQKFKHLVFLKSDETAGVTLHLNDDIRLEKLSSDWNRLRAYYYAEESDSYTLFTPYMSSKSKDMIKLLKSK